MTVYTLGEWLTVSKFSWRKPLAGRTSGHPRSIVRIVVGLDWALSKTSLGSSQDSEAVEPSPASAQSDKRQHLGLLLLVVVLGG